MIRFLLTRLWIGFWQLYLLLIVGTLIGVIAAHVTGEKPLGWLAGLVTVGAVNRAFRVKGFHWSAF
ncbi:MAG: hypothetical protein IT325_09905 [Anaerolineae bacterium]|nr:hypothetical protein [Anaerolineae bacterium]